MADFAYLFRGGLTQGSPEELAKNMEKWGGWMKDLGARGLFKAGEPLEAAGKVVRGTKKSITDGPYAEAKDLVGGFMIVSAKDIAEATELAKGCPIFEHDGTVEVRPVRMMQRP